MRFEDSDIGGKEVGPVKISIHGDPVVGNNQIGYGRTLLGELKKRMSLGDIKVGESSKTVEGITREGTLHDLLVNGLLAGIDKEILKYVDKQAGSRNVSRDAMLKMINAKLISKVQVTVSSIRAEAEMADQDTIDINVQTHTYLSAGDKDICLGFIVRIKTNKNVSLVLNVTEPNSNVEINPYSVDEGSPFYGSGRQPIFAPIDGGSDYITQTDIEKPESTLTVYPWQINTTYTVTYEERFYSEGDISVFETTNPGMVADTLSAMAYRNEKYALYTESASDPLAPVAITQAANKLPVVRNYAGDYTYDSGTIRIFDNYDNNLNNYAFSVCMPGDINYYMPNRRLVGYDNSYPESFILWDRSHVHEHMYDINGFSKAVVGAQMGSTGPRFALGWTEVKRFQGAYATNTWMMHTKIPPGDYTVEIKARPYWGFYPDEEIEVDIFMLGSKMTKYKYTDKIDSTGTVSLKIAKITVGIEKEFKPEQPYTFVSVSDR